MVYSYKFSWLANSFIATTIIVFLSEWIQKTGIINFPLGFRHLMIVFLFVINWGFYGRKLIFPGNYKLWLISISLFLIIACFFSSAPLLNYLLGIVFTFLFVIMFVLGANTKSKTNVILKIFKGLLIFFLLMSIIPMSEGLFGEVSFRWVPTLFRELGAYAAAMNIGTIVALSMYIITSKKKYLYLAIFFSFAVLLTILKKTIISNIIVWFVFYILHTGSKNKMKLIFYFIISIFIGYYIVGNSLIDNYNQNANYLEGVGPSGHVRIAMYIASYNIALDYFPFGSGMGTFGSLSSIINGYSNVYFDYGVSTIGSNSPTDVAAGHHTLLDTYWPHILGELGFIGTLLFLYLWFYPVKLALFKIRSTKDTFIKGLSFYILLVVITISWEGFTLYTPEIPSFVLLLSGLSGLCYYHIRRNTTYNSV